MVQGEVQRSCLVSEERIFSIRAHQYMLAFHFMPLLQQQAIEDIVKKM